LWVVVDSMHTQREKPRSRDQKKKGVKRLLKEKRGPKKEAKGKVRLGNQRSSFREEKLKREKVSGEIESLGKKVSKILNGEYSQGFSA